MADRTALQRSGRNTISLRIFEPFVYVQDNEILLALQNNYVLVVSNMERLFIHQVR